MARTSFTRAGGQGTKPQYLVNQIIDAALAALESLVPQPRYQTVAYAATITIDPAAGEIVKVGNLTGNITVAAPTTPVLGDRLNFIFRQDATGSRTITWNAVFLNTPSTSSSANSFTTGCFVYDGVNWVGY